MQEVPSHTCARGGGVLRLPQNSVGRDFVVGDIHGAYDLVWAAMKAVAFDSRYDRLFCTGDLIDRGAGSARVMKFLDQPNVFTVMGNHDANFLQLNHEDVEVLAIVNMMGMRWARGLSSCEFMAIRARLATLPIAIEVQTTRGLVGIVHGDVPSGVTWQEFIRQVEEGDAEMIDCALNGRNRVLTDDQSGIDGIGRVFVGHTVCWDGPRRFGNVYAIDTGAVFSEIDSAKPRQSSVRGFLTLANLGAATDSLVRTAHSDEHSTRLIVHADASALPFSDSVALRERPC